MDRKERNQKLSHLGYLASMSKSDMGIDDRERKFFFWVADRLDVGTTTAQKILDHPEDMQLKKPEFHEHRREVLMDILTMMVVDKKLDKKELELCRKFSYHMGFRSDIVEKVVKGLFDYSLNNITKVDVQELIDQL